VGAACGGGHHLAGPGQAGRSWRRGTCDVRASSWRSVSPSGPTWFGTSS